MSLKIIPLLFAALLPSLAAHAAPAKEPAITCPCYCVENYFYRFIRVTPSSVGLPAATERGELFYHVERACRNYCERTTGRPDSYSRACI